MNLEALQAVAMAVAAERSLDRILATIASGLAAQPGVALARVWLIAPGDICHACPMRAGCRDRTRCLHLLASAGGSVDGRQSWTRLDGAFRRIPLAALKVGRIAMSGEGLLVGDVAADSTWIARPEWAKAERIRSFGGQPLVFRGELLGVLGVFSRDAIDRRMFAWLRTFADHAAIAIAHARALGEIERLKEQLELENMYLRAEVRSSAPAGLIGESAALRRVLALAATVAPTTATVLLHGESGTGKELLARAIHDQSPRRQGPLISVNCASVPRDLFESEFFGHVRGAFTGALRDRAGRFQAADRGTLLLDEVGEIPVELQPKLLRVLQDGRFERVGEETTRGVDVRVIAATNRDLEREAEAGRFRRDLFYRLSVFPIKVPALRDRLEDIPALAAHFLETAARRFGRPAPRLTAAAIRRLQEYHWPGNIRELQHVIERACLLSSGRVLQVDDVLAKGDAPPVAFSEPPAPSAPAAATVIPELEWRRRERENLRAALQAAGGRIYGAGGAAELLGIAPTTLSSRLKTLGLRVRRQGSEPAPGGAV